MKSILMLALLFFAASLYNLSDKLTNKTDGRATPTTPTASTNANENSTASNNSATITFTITLTHKNSKITRTRDTDTFIKRGGRWQVLASQSSKMS